MLRFLSFGVVFLVLPAAASAQGLSSSLKRMDAAVTYQRTRTNTQPGDCGCFALNGGGVSASWRIGSSFAAVAEVSAGSANNGPGTGNSLTLVSYVGGVRYLLPAWGLEGHHRPQPFLQVTVGGAHAGGGMAGAGDHTFALITRAGGGYDLPVRNNMALRAIQVEYERTGFANAVNARQNNLLLATGVALRW